MANINNLFPSKWLKAQDLPAGGVTVTISNMVMEDVEQGKPPQPVLHFHGKDKGLVLNKTNAMLIAHTYGIESDAWVGKPIHLHKEPVQFQGRIVDAIRCKGPSGPPPADTAETDTFDDTIPF